MPPVLPPPPPPPPPGEGVGEGVAPGEGVGEGVGTATWNAAKTELCAALRPKRQIQMEKTAMCGRGEPSLGADGRGERSPGADVAGVSPPAGKRKRCDRAGCGVKRTCVHERRTGKAAKVVAAR